MDVRFGLQKKVEHQRIYIFELWCWRRLLRVSWTARRSNQSILRKISPEYSLEGLMLKLKLQYFGHLSEELTHLKRPCCWKRLKAGEGDDRRWNGWMASPTLWTWVWVSSRSWWWTVKSGVLQSMGSQSVGHDRVIELNWTEHIAVQMNVLSKFNFSICIYTQILHWPHVNIFIFTQSNQLRLNECIKKWPRGCRFIKCLLSPKPCSIQVLSFTWMKKTHILLPGDSRKEKQACEPTIKTRFSFNKGMWKLSWWHDSQVVSHLSLDSEDTGS